jgi:translocator assembly and maintenance protein 41
LLLPFEFTEEELFTAIAGLSYTGDFRMIYGENPNKIYNIVQKQFEEFQSIYRPIIQDLPAVDYLSGDRIVQEDSLKVRGAMIQQLPKKLQQKIQYHHKWYLNRMDQFRSVNALEPHFSQSIANSPELPIYVKRGISEIIRGPALGQAVKGIFTAGLVKSFFYISAKITKVARAR